MLTAKGPKDYRNTTKADNRRIISFIKKTEIKNTGTLKRIIVRVYNQEMS